MISRMHPHTTFYIFTKNKTEEWYRIIESHNLGVKAKQKCYTTQIELFLGAKNVTP